MTEGERDRAVDQVIQSVPLTALFQSRSDDYMSAPNLSFNSDI